MKAKRHEEAAAVCLAVFEATGDPAAGSSAAQAQKALGQDEEVLKLLDRLRGTAAEGEVLALAGDVERKRGNRERARVNYERALKLAQEAGNARETARAADTLFYMAWEDADARSSLKYALASFEAAEELRESDQQVRASLALYSALFGLGDLAGAGRALDRAELHAAANDIALSYVLLNRGALRLEEGRMALSRDASNPRTFAWHMLRLGARLRHRGEPSSPAQRGREKEPRAAAEGQCPG